MDFDRSEAQRDIAEHMRSIGEEAAGQPADRRLGALAAAGVLGLSIPKEHGGSGLDLVTTAMAFEALGETLPDGGTLLAAGAHLFGVAMPIVALGTEAQRRAWLPRLARGEILATVGATEEGAGSDIAKVETIAAPTAAGYRVTGHKRYVANAITSGLFFTVAKLSGEGAGRGLVVLLVPSGSGVRPGAPYATNGLPQAKLGPVTFEDVAVDHEAVLGRAGAGLAVFQVAMAYERALILAFRLGAMARELREAVKFVKARRVGETPIGSHQAVSHRIARMKLRLETARLMTYRAAWALDRGGRPQLDTVLAKWHVAEAAVASALDAYRLRGGAAFLEENQLGASIEDALGGTIHSGTEDVLASIVAAWMGV